MTYQNLIVETRDKVGIIRHQPAAGAQCAQRRADRRSSPARSTGSRPIRWSHCIIITGSDKAFAAGADIKEMAGKSYMDAFFGDFAGDWDHAARARKPIIAAVAGFALGGGCELAMQCDLIIAADNAKFGQPEIKLGVIPGIGGTQRLTRAVGKAKAMDLILTGRMMDAAEAERAGLVARVVPLASLMDEAIKAAETIAAMSLPSLMLAKESGQPRVRDEPRRKASGSSGACSTRCSRPRIRRKAWRRSSRSARRISRTGDGCDLGACSVGEPVSHFAGTSLLPTQITRTTDALAASRRSAAAVAVRCCGCRGTA